MLVISQFQRVCMLPVHTVEGLGKIYKVHRDLAVIWYSVQKYFSNSLITHRVKIKKITSVNPVLISIDFDDFTSPFTP